jgi:hypothetical protein
LASKDAWDFSNARVQAELLRLRDPRSSERAKSKLEFVRRLCNSLAAALGNTAMPNAGAKSDVFISRASEDDAFVKRLARSSLDAAAHLVRED